MKTKIFTLAAIAALILASCQTFEEVDGYILKQSANPYAEHVFTADELFPNGDAEIFVIYPSNGWTVKYGEVIVFKALLLDETTGVYADVTNKQECKFDFSYGSGKSINGSDPSLKNGQDITIRAVWANTWSAQSTGTYIEDPEWVRPEDE